MRKNSPKSSSILITILSIGYVIHDMPAVGYYCPSVLFAILVILLFASLVRHVGISSFAQLIPIYIVSIMYFVFNMSKGISFIQFLQELSGLFQALIYPLLAIWIINNNDIKQGRTLFAVYLLCAIITIITTYYGNKVYPDASRQMATGLSEFQSLYNSLNIGGFQFVYSIALLSPLAFFVLRDTKNNRTKIAVLALILLELFMLLEAQYTIALIIFAFSILVIVMPNKTRFSSILVSLLLISIFCYAIKGPIGAVIQDLSEVVAADQVADRMQNIAMELQGIERTEHSDLDSRKEMYDISVNTFKNHPLGIWTYDNARIGGHSYFIDTLARFGILGLFLMIWSIVTLYRLFCRRYVGTKFLTTYSIAFLLAIFAACVNPVFFFDILTFVFPLGLFCYESQWPTS